MGAKLFLEKGVVDSSSYDLVVRYLGFDESKGILDSFDIVYEDPLDYAEDKSRIENYGFLSVNFSDEEGSGGSTVN